ncbi:MAG TPA: type II toxin-antitoxin system HigB family toxin [Acinetobacter sp.]|jgi:mRNA interferase HigB|nr:type II toxin-antitoxin system HigB family toxin [Acinetobacter sp.]HQZ58561.1 type II toxin-antitoxin system HigB family toxin [Acinetobacter sp.]
MNFESMHIIAKSRLRLFWEGSSSYLDAKEPLTEWYRHFEKAHYATPQEIKAVFGTTSILKGGRVVFNIGGNKYRLIVAFDFERQLGFIKFVGTHAQYDDIDAETV